MLNSMLFDAAPPLGLFLLAALIVVVPIIILLIVITVWLIKKAAAKKKRNTDIENGINAEGQTGRPEK